MYSSSQDKLRSPLEISKSHVLPAMRLRCNVMISSTNDTRVGGGRRAQPAQNADRFPGLGQRIAFRLEHPVSLSLDLSGMIPEGRDGSKSLVDGHETQICTVVTHDIPCCVVLLMDGRATSDRSAFACLRYCPHARGRYMPCPSSQRKTRRARTWL
jgi:hypothetical protein